jgi:hypothetical protein
MTTNIRTPAASRESTASTSEDEQGRQRRRGYVAFETIAGNVETIEGEIITGTWPLTDVPAVDILYRSSEEQVQLPLDRVLRIVYDTSEGHDSRR